MNTNELVTIVSKLEPSELKSFFSLLSAALSKRAEQVYDMDPENNGMLAQPYAKMSDALTEASRSFEPSEPLGLEDDEVKASVVSTTVTSVIQARSNNPWGGR